MLADATLMLADATLMLTDAAYMMLVLFDARGYARAALIFFNLISLLGMHARVES